MFIIFLNGWTADILAFTHKQSIDFWHLNLELAMSVCQSWCILFKKETPQFMNGALE